MDFKGWGDLDTRQWWLAILAVSGPLLIRAGATGRITTSLIAAKVFVWGIGEWVQHPIQQFRKDGFNGTRYPRVWSLFGVGRVNLSFFSSSMTPEVAARKYLPSMRIAVKEIERRWSAANKARGKIA
jgi:hypothetical protein